MDHPRTGLKYVDADDLDDTTFDFHDLDVVDAAGEKLGTIDGFILDVNAARPYYVVVDAGGWFKSKYFLMPIGQVTLDRDRRTLLADVSRDRVERYPGFDPDEFEAVTDSELGRMDREMTAICAPGESIETSTVYRTPTWWQSSYYRADRPVAATTSGAASTMRQNQTMSEAERRQNSEQVVAREGADTDDVSPHAGGRAQPGDVLGVETGGEQTHIGETTEDENERRRDGEKAASKLTEDRDRR